MKTSIERLIQKRFIAKNFCTSFEEDSSLLSLQVEGLAPIKLPIQPKTAKQLIALAKPSKFGFREKTLYDQSVRNSFEIDSSKIHLGANFQEKINSTLKKIKHDLLLPASSELRADLHNLLIYEKGCFFDFHQDSEKEDGMIASLIIVFPSNYQGGDLVIEYQGQTKNFGDLRYRRPPNSTKFQCFAFYADCRHKLEKVSYGYRIALTFNLIIENPQEIQRSNKNSGLARAVEEYFSTTQDQPLHRRDRPKWFVFFLNHQYTQKSLNWKTLKGADKVTAAEFKQVAQNLELDIYLSLAAIQETWSAYEESDDDYHHRRYSRRKYRSREDEENTNRETTENSENFEIQDMVDSETTLDGWLDANGNAAKFGAHYVTDSMIFMAKENGKFVPESSEYEGYMGNYGNTLDRWYRRSAIVLWPQKISLASKFAINANLGVEEVIKLLKSSKKNGLFAYENLKSNLLKPQELARIDGKLLIDLMIALNEHRYLQEILVVAKIDYLLGVKAVDLQMLLTHYGDKTVSSLMQARDERERWEKDSTHSCSEIIVGIFEKYPLTAGVLLRHWLENLDYQLTPYQGQLASKDRQKSFLKDTQEMLVLLAKTLRLIKKELQFKQVFASLYKNKEIFGAVFLYEILQHKYLKEILDLIPAYFSLRKEALVKIELILQKPLSESDWSIDELPVCDCELCLPLKEFLSSSASQEKIWPLSKIKRQHIHGMIDGLELPVSHKTIREGSPHRLVLKKKKTIFSWRKNRQEKYRELCR
jgi:hypothetical protein